MADSSISSLGLGSSGVLSYDVIDQLKKVDENAIITPIDNNIKKNETELNDLSILTSLTASLKAETSTLSSDMTYLSRTATSSSDAVGVTALAGSQVQDFSFNVDALAKSDIYQSDAYSSESDTFTDSDDTITFNVDGQDYSIDVTSSTTLEEFKEEIYGATDGKVTASLLNVGGDNPYRLVLKSTDTGTDNAITISSNGSAVSDLGLDKDENHIQAAADLSATYNGVSITRSSNTVDDLIVGVTLEAQKVGDANISIKQDTDLLNSSISSFVTKYNDLMNNLNESTKYDPKTKASGTFQGSSEIKGLKSDLSRSLLSVDDKGRSLSDYGITTNSLGLLEFDSSVFNAKMAEDSADVEDFFSGNSDTDGFFTSYNDMLKGYTNSNNGTLIRFDTTLTDKKNTLEQDKIDATKRLDNKYDIMAKKFAAYDNMISQMNSSFQSLSMQIDAMSNKSN
jgi:flagellar hook-associated protein 2